MQTEVIEKTRSFDCAIDICILRGCHKVLCKQREKINCSDIRATNRRLNRKTNKIIGFLFAN